MKTLKLKRFAVLALALGAGACAFADTTTLHSKEATPEYMGLSTEAWTNDVGTVAKWDDYNDGNTIAHICHTGVANAYYQSTITSGDFNFYGLDIELSKRTTLAKWRQMAGTVAVGAGGINVRSANYNIGCGNNATEQMTLKLTADQTWTGSNTSGATYLHVGGLGKKDGSSMVCPLKSRLVAAEGVTSLRIDGKLQAMLYSPDNDLSSVTVTVADSALLFLSDLVDARLNAAKLVLSGSGSRMAFGATSDSEAKPWFYPMSDSFATTNIVAIDHAHLAPVVELNAGAGFSANGGVWGLTNLVVSGAADSISTISGSLTFAQPTTKIEFSSGATLSLDTDNAAADGVSPGFVLSGSGTLCVRDVAPFTGAVEVGEGTTFKVVTAAGDAVSYPGAITGAGALAVDATAQEVYLPSTVLASFTGAISVLGGTLVLDAPLADGRLTVADGASVLYGSDSLVVTDAVRTETKITVGTDQTLRVFGNGLTAATTVELNGGTLRFESTATVASPISLVADASAIETAAASVTGTITGAFTSSLPGEATYDSGKGTRIRGEGCVKLSGGGEFTGFPNKFFSEDGTVWFCGGEWKFTQTRCGLTYSAKDTGTYGRKWLVSDGATLTVVGVGSGDNSRSSLEAQGLNNQYDYTNESAVEVRDGGKVELGAYSRLILGHTQATGRLTVGKDGEVKVTAATAEIRVGYSMVTTGIIELGSGGVLETCVPFIHAMSSAYESTQTQGRFYWNGGTLKIGAKFPASEATLFRNSATTKWDSANNSLRTWVKVMGDDCTLDLSDLPERETALANVPAGLQRSEWFGTGRLTVKGGRPFTFQSLPNGITLRAEGEGTQILIPSGVEIHDYEKCVANEIVKAGKLVYETLSNCLSTLTAKLEVAGGTIDLGGVTTTISALAGDVASSGGAITNDASATYPATVTVQNGQLAVEKNKSRYALFTVGSGYASAAPAATLDGTTAEGWTLALQGRVLTLLNPHPRGLLVIVR